MITNDPKEVKIYCANCRFFDNRLNKDNFGICRKNSPRPFRKEKGKGSESSLSSFFSFPLVDLDGWCGEFEVNGNLKSYFDPEVENRDVGDDYD